MKRWIPSLLLWASICESAYLTPSHIKQVKANMDDYLYAQQMTGVPWQALAAIHWREAEFNRRPGCIGGAFGMDKGGGKEKFERNIWKEEDRVRRKYGIRDDLSVQTNFRFACLCAGDELKGKARGRIYRKFGIDEDVLFDAIWGYNGRDRRHKSWRGSPYTANDPQKKKLFLLRRIRRDGSLQIYVDKRPGAVPIYRELLKLP